MFQLSKQSYYLIIGLLNCFWLLFTILCLINLYQSHCLNGHDATEADTVPLTVMVVDASKVPVAEKVEEIAADHDHGQPGVWSETVVWERGAGHAF